MLDEYYLRLMKYLSKQNNLCVEKYLFPSYIGLWLNIPPAAHFDMNVMIQLVNRMLERKVFVFSPKNKEDTPIDFTEYILSHDNLKKEMRTLKIKKIYG